MARFEEVSVDLLRFVRYVGEVRTGLSHEFILFVMGWGRRKPEILTVMEKRGGVDLDMGYLLRNSDNEILVLRNSSTFDYPPYEQLDEIRMRTLEVLRGLYDEEKFRRSDL